MTPHYSYFYTHLLGDVIIVLIIFEYIPFTDTDKGYLLWGHLTILFPV